MSKASFSQLHRHSLSSTALSNYSNYHERDLKVDKRILEIMREGGNNVIPSANEFFNRIINQTQVKIDFSSTFKDRQGNEIPIVKVIGNNMKNLEAASALIMEYLDPHRDKMTFNIDVPYNDHSYIIGKDGSRIKQLSRETGCHIHLPDCNKTSGKKSNKLSIAGTSFESIEQARNQIRKSLPLNIGFKAKIKSRKFVYIDTSSSEVQAIKRKYRLDVTFTNVASNSKYTEVTINVKGGRSQLEEIKSATQELYQFVTGEEIYTNPVLDFTITIDVSHSHHQYVKGKNNCNLKVIHQRSKSLISFPPNDMEVNQVVIQGKDLLSTVMGWQELMGYLPLLLSFDVNFDISKMQSDIQRLEKEYGVGIRIREKLTGHVYTVLIKTQERHSICLQEIRQRILLLKSKVEKINNEQNANHFKGLNLIDNYVQMKSSYLNSVPLAKSLTSTCYNPYYMSSKAEVEQSNCSSAKYPRFSFQQSNLALMESCRNFYSNQYNNYRKPKGYNKLSPVDDYSYLPFYNQLISNQLLSNESCSPSQYKSGILTSINSSPVSSNATTGKNAPLKAINLDMNFNSSFDPLFADTTNYSPKHRFNPTESSKVDYSFSRFSYQNYCEKDSGNGSSMRVSPDTTFSSAPDSLINQENEFSNHFNIFKNFNLKHSISQLTN